MINHSQNPLLFNKFKGSNSEVNLDSLKGHHKVINLVETLEVFDKFPVQNIKKRTQLPCL